MPKLKLTQPQYLVLHLIESILGSAILTALLAAYEYVGVHGLNWTGLLTVFLAALLGGMAKGFIGLQNNANVPPAIFDSLNEIKALIADVTQAGTDVMSTPPVSAGPKPIILPTRTQPATTNAVTDQPKSDLGG